MPFLTKKGTIVATTAGSPPVSQAVTGVGFTPKAVLIWGQNITSANSYATNNYGSFGFATSSSDRKSMTWAADDNLATTNSARRSSSALCLYQFTDGTGGIDGSADLTSMDSDGFTLSWTNLLATGQIIHYMALGGDDLTNAKTGTFSTVTSNTSNIAVTGVGFQPDCVIFLNTGNTASNSNSNSVRAGVGVATSTSSRWSTNWADTDNVGSPSSASYLTTSKCYGTALTTIQSEGDLVSMDADGFTVSVTTATAGRLFYFLCLKGGRYYVGTESQATSNTTKVTTGVGFKPVGAFFTGINLASPSGTQNGYSVSMGATDGTDEGGVWHGVAHLGVVGNSDTNQYTTDTKSISHNTLPQTNNSSADILSFDADGYTLTWNTNDAVARTFGYLVFGSTTYSRTASGALAMAASNARTPLYARTATPTVGLAGSNTRAALYNRSASGLAAFSPSASSMSVFSKTASAAIDIDEAYTRAALYARSASGLLSLSSANTITTNYSRTNAYSIDIDEAIAAASLLARSTSNSLTLSEAFVRAALYSRLAGKSISYSTSESASAGIGRYTTNAVSFSEALSASTLYARNISAAFSLVQSYQRTANYSRLPTFLLALDDDYSAAVIRSASVSNSVSFTPVFTKSTSYGRLVSLALTLAALNSRQATYDRSASRSLSLTIPELYADVRKHIELDQSISFIEDIDPTLATNTYLSDGLTLSTTGSRARVTSRTLGIGLILISVPSATRIESSGRRSVSQAVAFVAVPQLILPNFPNPTHSLGTEKHDELTGNLPNLTGAEDKPDNLIETSSSKW